MEKGNLFDFPLITTLVVIRCNAELRYFASVDGDWTDLILHEVKLRMRMYYKDNVKI